MERATLQYDGLPERMVSPENQPETDPAVILGIAACQLCVYCDSCELEGEPKVFIAPREQLLAHRDKWKVNINGEAYELSDVELDVLEFAVRRGTAGFMVGEFAQTDFHTISEGNARSTAASRAIRNLRGKLSAQLTHEGEGKSRRYTLAEGTAIRFEGEMIVERPAISEKPSRSAGAQLASRRSAGRIRAESDGDSKGTEIDVDLVKLYLKEIGTVSLLTKEDEARLGERVARGLKANDQLEAGENLSRAQRQELERQRKDGLEAQNEFANANLRLVVSIAKRYQGKGLQLLDLIQEGNLGLMHAVGKFDYKKGFKFSTYATWWIRQAIDRGLANTGRTIRLPVHAGDPVDRIQKNTMLLTDKYGRTPTNEEIASASGTNVEKVVEVLLYPREPISLEKPLDDDGEFELKDKVGDRHAVPPEEAILRSQLGLAFKEVLAQLDEREREVVTMRFGLDDGEPKTLDIVGERFSLTRERIRQIEAKAMSKLRHPKNTAKLQSFLED